MEKLSKINFIEKWKSMSKDVKFTIVNYIFYIKGKLYTNKEASIVRRLQANYIVGSALKTIVPGKITNIYLSCTTKNNILILCELVLINSNHIYAEVKYKSESNNRENDFENFMTILLSDVPCKSEMDFTCR
jgi:hypothetical protein